MKSKKNPGLPEQRAYYGSPIGTIELIGNDDGLLGLRFISRGAAPRRPVPPVLKEAVRELDDYFKGKRTTFTVRPVLRGTAFQRAVWRRLLEIPCGETVSYGRVAGSIGKPKAVRAVGMANAMNKVSIIIPCHRVIGSDGRLTGYGGGLWRKEWLLAHERKLRREAR